jgi:hypothetical protein
MTGIQELWEYEYFIDLHTVGIYSSTILIPFAKIFKTLFIKISTFSFLQRFEIAT